MVSVLKRLVKKMRRRLGKKLDIEIRADSGFATPALYDFCESEKLSYVIGFARNSRVQAGGKGHGRFPAHPRGAANNQKVEVTDLGLNRRFVVTNREDLSAEDLYEHYVDRGQAENFVKALINPIQHWFPFQPSEPAASPLISLL